eukprot:TRINITY_DN1808_c0_g1_i1.p1 TRINITY_DN1808_c0_g1~~TRINITY_DN1808_c0_g1_i1.p1  ORF type:complete len:907 (-),score=230.93 TRINITY_DN1808_c0_g1_i1:74-2794(-)
MIVYGNDAMLRDAAVVSAGFRIMYATSRNAAAVLPVQALDVWSWFALFAGDLLFVQPGCGDLIPWQKYWVINVVVIAMTFGAVLAALPGIFHYREWHHIKREQQLFIADQQRRRERQVASDRIDPDTQLNELSSHNVVMQAMSLMGALTTQDLQRINLRQENSDDVRFARRQAFKKTLLRALFWLVPFLFDVSLMLGFGGIFCLHTPAGILLVADMEQVCFTGAHIPVFLFSLVLLGAALATPTGMILLLRKPPRVGDDETSSSADSLVVTSIPWRIHELYVLLLLHVPLALWSVFLQYSVAHGILKVAFLVGVLIYVLYERLFEQLLHHVLLLCAVITAIFIAISMPVATVSVQAGTGFASVGIAGAAIYIVLVTLLIVMRVAQRLRLFTFAQFWSKMDEVTGKDEVQRRMSVMPMIERVPTKPSTPTTPTAVLPALSSRAPSLMRSMSSYRAGRMVRPSPPRNAEDDSSPPSPSAETENEMQRMMQRQTSQENSPLVPASSADVPTEDPLVARELYEPVVAVREMSADDPIASLARTKSLAPPTRENPTVIPPLPGFMQHQRRLESMLGARGLSVAKRPAPATVLASEPSVARSRSPSQPADIARSSPSMRDKSPSLRDRSPSMRDRSPSKRGSPSGSPLPSPPSRGSAVPAIVPTVTPSQQSSSPITAPISAQHVTPPAALSLPAATPTSTIQATITAAAAAAATITPPATISLPQAPPPTALSARRGSSIYAREKPSAEQPQSTLAQQLKRQQSQSVEQAGLELEQLRALPEIPRTQSDAAREVPAPRQSLQGRVASPVRERAQSDVVAPASKPSVAVATPPVTVSSRPDRAESLVASPPASASPQMRRFMSTFGDAPLSARRHPSVVGIVLPTARKSQSTAGTGGTQTQSQQPGGDDDNAA